MHTPMMTGKRGILGNYIRLKFPTLVGQLSVMCMNLQKRKQCSVSCSYRNKTASALAKMAIILGDIRFRYLALEPNTYHGATNH